jgi:hypothetical protein
VELPRDIEYGKHPENSACCFPPGVLVSFGFSPETMSGRKQGAKGINPWAESCNEPKSGDYAEPELETGNF